MPSLNGIPIGAILGDQQAALFGQAGFKPGEAKVCSLILLIFYSLIEFKLKSLFIDPIVHLWNWFILDDEHG